MEEYIEKTWKEIEALPKDETVICVTIAPIEEHSHHLPLGTDLYEGECWLKGMADQLEKKMPQLKLLHLPPVTVASASAAYRYSLHYTPKLTKEVVYQMLEGLQKSGFQHIIIIASHGDPIHHAAIERACDDINKKYGICCMSPMGAFFSGDHIKLPFEMPEDLIKEESQVNDIHAGWVETSAMLNIKPELVKDLYKQLPDTRISDKEMGNQVKLIEAMGEFGHLGAPRLAEKEMGERLIENVCEYLLQAVTHFISREDYEVYCHHFLTYMPFMAYAFK